MEAISSGRKSPRLDKKGTWNLEFTLLSLATNLELATFYWVFLVTLLPNDMAVCFSHADSFEKDQFDQNSLAESE